MAEDFYSIRRPRDVLKPFVRRVMVADCHQPDGFVVHAAPTGYNYVGWHASGDAQVLVDGVATEHGTFHFAGQLRGQHVTVTHTGHVVHIIAELTATGLARLLHVPGAAIFGKPAPVGAVSPECERALAPLLDLQDVTLEARADAFQSVLAGMVPRAAPPIDYLEQAIARIEKARGRVRIGDLCRSLEISQRHLSRTFKEIVGIGPKYFAKVIQLNTALGALVSGDEDYISIVSHEFGYSDQAHFVHVMQEFLRMGPTAFLESNDEVLGTFLVRSQIGAYS